MAGVQMGRADLEPVAVGWERSRRRWACPRRYGQTHGGRDRTDEDARKWGRAFHDEWCSCYLTRLSSCYSAICYSNIGIPDQPSLLGSSWAHISLQRGIGVTQSPASSVFSRSVLHESWFAKRVRAGSRGRKLSLARYDNLCRTACGIQLRESGVAGCSPQNKIMQQNHA
jgi:hypothetical protein